MSNDKSKGSLINAVEKVSRVSTKDDLDEKADRNLEDQRLKDAESNRQLREGYANKVYCYLVVYSILAFVLVVADGFKLGGFDLDTTVVSIIVGSTAASAIGLVGFVVKGLFK